MKSKVVDKWRNNRTSSLALKVKRWKSNPFGATARFFEILYFGQPLINIFIGNSGKNGNSTGVELVFHLTDSVNKDLTDENYIFLNDVRIDLWENFIQLDTGHILNNRKKTNELFSGQYWDLVRKIQKSRVAINPLNQTIYPIANQKYFYHFLLEELPEIIHTNELGIVEKFVSLNNQPTYVRELIDLAGIKVEYIEGDIQCYRKVVCPTYSRSNTSWSVSQLQMLIRSAAKQFHGPEKILLLRAGGARYDSGFEQLLRDFLTPRGFEVIDPDLLSNAEQIALFNLAKEIVAIHGGALSNMVFTKKDCRIFEIFTHSYRTYFFRDIARMKGNEYIGAESDHALELLKIWLA